MPWFIIPIATHESRVSTHRTDTQENKTNTGGIIMNCDYLRNCSMMLYFSIRLLDGRAMAIMSSVTLG